MPQLTSTAGVGLEFPTLGIVVPASTPLTVPESVAEALTGRTDVTVSPDPATPAPDQQPPAAPTA